MNEYKLTKLKNGLRLLLVPRKASEVVTVMAMFKVGGRYESEEIAGISHVLEHMHYKGTPKRPSGLKVAEFIESIGGEHNAFTGKECTGYHAKVAPKHLEKAFDFLSDLLLNSLFKPEDLEREKQVILQEIDMYEDLPMQIVGNKFEEAVFGKNALGRDVIGYKKTVQALSRDDLVKYRSKHYSASNAVLALAGNFGDLSEDEIESLAEKYFNFDHNQKEILPSIDIPNESGSNIIEKKTEQSHVVVGFRTVPLSHSDYHKLEMLALILGGSMSSRMFEEIREKRGLAYAVRTSTANYIEAGFLETQAGVPHDKVDETIEAIMGEYKKMKTEKVESEELQKAKEIVYGKMLIKFEDSEELVYHYASDELFLEKIDTPEELAKIYQNITADDIMEVANKYFTKDRLGIAFIGPKFDKEKIEKLLTI